MSTLKKTVGSGMLLLIPLMMGNCGSRIHADELMGEHYDLRLAELETELQSLRCQLNSRCRANSSSQSGRKEHGAYAGTGIVFARPHFKESFQYSQINFVNGQQTLHPFSFDYGVTPRVWLGMRTRQGLGIHVDYWQYHHSSNPASAVSDGLNVFSSNATTIIFPATIVADDPGETLTADSSLETQILNLLGTFHASFRTTDVRAGMGLRYVVLNQELASSVTNSIGIPQGILNWSRRYEGLGPAAALEARRRLGKSGLSVIAAGGGSLLFGSKTLDRFVTGDIGVPPAAPFLRLDDADEVVGVGELNFGLEWAHCFCNRTQVAIQGRYEGQLWAEAGAPTLGFLGFEGFGIFAEIRR